MKRDVTAITISDLHCFNNLCPTHMVVEQSMRWVEDHTAVLKQADLFIIGGDWFHRGVHYSSPLVFESLTLITFIGKFCYTHGLKLRILEGTKSHDMNQNVGLVHHLAVAYPDLDVKLFKTICIEHISEWDMDILYVPDDMGSAEHVWSEVQKVLIEKSLSVVDMAIMHGCFTYQLPQVSLATSHDEDLFSSIVRYFITIGHHHVYNPHPDGVIVPQGSLSRTAHGQEEPKGGIIMYMSPDIPARHTFLENKHATPFIKYNLTDNILKDEANIRKLTELDNELMHIRLVGPDTNPLLSSTKALNAKYTHVKFTIEKTNEVTNIVKKSKVDYLQVVNINESNFPVVLEDYLKLMGVDNQGKIITTLRGFLDDELDR